MSFSVDDLVSSFNASHIGQEARDLAALQAQLAEALFGSSSYHANANPFYPTSPTTTTTTRGRTQNAHVRNTTPLASRAPSLSMRFGGGSGRAMEYEDVGMDEDERMVEELLLLPPTSPSHSTNSSYSNNNNNTTSYPTNANYSNTTFAPPPSTPTSAQTPSLFATTDPFYLAQAQAAQSFSNNATRNYTALASTGNFGTGFSFDSSNSGMNGAGMNTMNGQHGQQTFQYQQCAAAF